MIAERIHRWAQSGPDRTAVIHNDTPVTYGAYSRAIRQLCALLAGNNLPPTGIAIVLVRDLLDAWALVLALRTLGLTTIVVQTVGQAEGLGVREAACVVVTRREIGARSFESTSLAGTRVVTVPSLARLLREPALPEAALPQAGPCGGHILYSSGTTGTYKKLLIPAETEVARNGRRVETMRMDRDTVFHLLDFGLWTVAGYDNPGAVWHGGGCVVFDQRDDALENLFRHRITRAFLIPSMVPRLLATRGPDAPRVDFELMTSGGFMPLASAEQVIARLTDTLRITYGSTECVGVLQAFFRSGDDLNWYSTVEDRDVQVVDDHCVECAPGVEGDLRIRLDPTDCTGYLDDDETSARFFRSGYFHPGDRAVRREDGRIRIVGRTDEVLNVGGMKLAVAPFEEAIRRHLGVEAVCVFSGLNERGQDELVVAIESPSAPPQPALDAIAALPELAPVMASFKRCRYAVVGTFPRTRTGMNKIRRTALKNHLFGMDPGEP